MQPDELAPGLRLVVADCFEALREIPAASVDAIVTDPPYGINFMGKAWDGKAIEEAASRPRDLGGIERLTGDPDHPERRKMTVRTGSAFANRAGEAGAYDFSVTGNRAFQAWTQEWATEALRVLKPGGHLLCFASTRTYHRMASGVEDAGFEVRDTLAWMFGSGFPKSLDVGRAIDNAKGTEGAWRQEEHPGRGGARTAPGDLIGQSDHRNEENPDGLRHVYEPGSPEGRAWDGWGTALKPAFEPIVVARKPLSGTVAATVLAHGTGALNIDACRIEFQDADDEDEAKGKPRNDGTGGIYGADLRTGSELGNYDPPGRWPANVLLDPESAAILDDQTGELAAGNHPAMRSGRGDEKVYGSGWSSGTDGERRTTETGGASRFFYCAKVSRAERNAGLDGFDEQPSSKMGAGIRSSVGLPAEGTTSSEDRTARNHHPTVKPIALMRWLIRLVTPPGGLVVDPFTGSGSTGCAAALEGMQFLGIEREDDYAAIASARIRFWAEHGEETLEVVARLEAADRVREAIADTGQLDLLGGAV